MHSIFVAPLLLLVAWTPWAAADSPNVAVHTDLNCVILPDEQVDLSSSVPGVIEEVLVRRSERVRRDQVLAQMESSVEEATVALALSRERSDAEFRLREVELVYDTQRHDRLQALQARHVVSFQNLEDAERAAEAAELRVRLAEDRRREALLERRRADVVLALKTVRSPIDGVIVQRYKTVGEYVEDQPILRIARLDPLRVEVIVPLALFGVVHAGMQVAVRPETDPEHERITTITTVDAVADPGSGTFGVQLELPNPGLELPAGIKCKGRLLPRIASEPVEPAPTAPGVTGDPAFESADETVSAADANAQPGRDFATVAPLAAGARVGRAPRTCLTYEALDEEEQARTIARAAERLGGQAAISEVGERRTLGYIVLAPYEPRSGARRRLAARLRAASITDLAFIESGIYAGRLSLGTYDRAGAAERRSVALAQLGFDSEVQPRTRNHQAWRVELRLPADVEPEFADAALAAVPGGSVAQTTPCEPLRTAAR